MPYIAPQKRKNFDAMIDALQIEWVKEGAEEGTLNYIISRLVWRYLREAPSYRKFNMILGVLVSIQMEIYRRLEDAYEEEKMKQNGDIE